MEPFHNFHSLLTVEPTRVSAQSEESGFSVYGVLIRGSIFTAGTCLKTSELNYLVSQVNTANASVPWYSSIKRDAEGK